MSISDDNKQILEGLAVGAGIGITGSLISETSHWLGGPTLGYSKPSFSNFLKVAVSSGLAAVLVGVVSHKMSEYKPK